METLNIDEALDFLEKSLQWEYGMGGIEAALRALEHIYHPRTIQLLKAFIVQCNQVQNSQNFELAGRAGVVMGHVIAKMLELENHKAS